MSNPKSRTFGSFRLYYFLRKCRLSNDLHLFLLICLKQRVESRHLEAIGKKETGKKKKNIGEELSEGSRDQGKVIKQCLAWKGRQVLG